MENLRISLVLAASWKEVVSNRLSPLKKKKKKNKRESKREERIWVG